MPFDLVIRGSEEFGVLSRRLKAAGAKNLRKELRAGLRRAADPAKDAVPRTLQQRMPHRGGLAARMATTRMSLHMSTGSVIQIRILAYAPYDIKAMNQGKLLHPVFGGKAWERQSVPSGSFSDPIQQRAPQMRLEMIKVMRDVAQKIERGI